MNSPEPDIWRDLSVLLAVGEAQSSFAAARALGISHQTVSTRIDQLETRFDSVLVERSGTRWNLTAAGRGLALKARSIADLVERSGQANVRGANAGMTPLIMSCPELFFEHLLLPIWYRIHKELPTQPIRLRTLASVTDQGQNGGDLSLCLGRSLKADTSGVEVGTVTFRLYAHRGLFNLSEQTTPPSHFSVDNAVLGLPDLVWPELGPTRRVSCQTLSMVAAAVKGGQGIGVLPSFIACHEPTLVPLDGVNIAPFSLWIVTHSRSLRHSGMADNVAALSGLLRREIAPLLHTPVTASL